MFEYSTLWVFLHTLICAGVFLSRVYGDIWSCRTLYLVGSLLVGPTSSSSPIQGTWPIARVLILAFHRGCRGNLFAAWYLDPIWVTIDIGGCAF